MRNAVIDGKFQHLRIDHDQAAFLRRHAIEKRQDHRVDRHRLARAGGAGHKHMRHLGNVGDHRFTIDGLAERKRQFRLGLLEIAACQHFAQVDHFTLRVRQFNADGVASRNDCHARRNRAHRTGDVVSKADDTGRLDTRRRLQFIKRHDGTGLHIDDFPAHAEIFQHAFEQARILFERILGKRGIALDQLRLGKEMQRRHFEDTAILEEGRLCLALGARAGLRRRRGLFHASLAAAGRRRIVPFLTGERRAVIHIVNVERRFVIGSGRRSETGFTARCIARFRAAAHNAHIILAGAAASNTRQALEIRARGQGQMRQRADKLETATGRSFVIFVIGGEIVFRRIATRRTRRGIDDARPTPHDAAGKRQSQRAGNRSTSAMPEAMAPCGKLPMKRPGNLRSMSPNTPPRPIGIGQLWGTAKQLAIAANSNAAPSQAKPRFATRPMPPRVIKRSDQTASGKRAGTLASPKNCMAISENTAPG